MLDRIARHESNRQTVVGTDASKRTLLVYFSRGRRAVWHSGCLLADTFGGVCFLPEWEFANHFGIGTGVGADSTVYRSSYWSRCLESTREGLSEADRRRTHGLTSHRAMPALPEPITALITAL